MTLESDSLATLAEMYKNHSKHPLRQRAHCLILSNSGMKIKEIAKTLTMDRQSVIRWFNRWEEKGIGGLYTVSGQGRKRIFTPEDEKIIIKLTESNARKIEGILPELKEETGKTGSKSTIKRVLKRATFTWRRIRKSLKPKRDEADFQAAKEELNGLKQLEDKGLIDLHFFDESGFSLVPYVPYAWQKKGETIEVLSSRSQTINILGFMKRDNSLEPYCFEQSVNSSVVVACFDDFCNRRVSEAEQKGVELKVAYVIIDNASIHNSKEFRENEQRWEAQKMRIKRLPTYSPELNLIEILWRKMKYEWIGFEAYQSYKKLLEWVENMLKGFGEKYIINFD